jgi:hypothetical protein
MPQFSTFPHRIDGETQMDRKLAFSSFSDAVQTTTEMMHFYVESCTLPPAPHPYTQRHTAASNNKVTALCELQKSKMDQTKLGKKIIALWSNKKFAASFSGLTNMKRELFLTKHIKISDYELRKILMNVPSFLHHVEPKKKFKRRSYAVFGFAQLFQADIAEMFNFKNYRYILCVQDIYR